MTTTTKIVLILLALIPLGMCAGGGAGHRSGGDVPRPGLSQSARPVHVVPAPDGTGLLILGLAGLVWVTGKRR